MTAQPIRVLFLCTGNSARSIMAEVIARRHGMHARSAGSTPKAAPNPLAIETLARHGLPTDDVRSDHWDVYRDERFDLVVTLCDSAARETCPVFPGAPVHAHWGFPDPPAADDPAACFESVYQGLEDAIQRFLEDPDPNLAARAARVAAHVGA